MVRWRALAVAALLFAPSLAFGQAQIGAGHVWGNSTAAQRPPRDETVTAILDRALGSTRGAIFERSAGGWAIVGPSATVGLPWVSNGTGADPAYQQIPIASAISGLGTGIATALGINVGTAGSPVINGGALGSPSSAGTIPAFTLGGTLSGGGNQLNNIIIGTATPLAGSFTTLAASTSVSTPIYTSSGSHQFQSNGSTFAGNINTSQQWYIGTSNVSPPATTLATISGNTAQLPIFTQTNVPQLQVSAADAARSMIGIRQFGASAGTLAFAHAGNTAASPSATASGTAIGLFVGYGYQTTTNAYVTGGGAGMQMVATDNFTSTVAGEELQFYTTPTGTAAIALAGKFQASGGFSVGAASDPGIGAIAVNTSYKIATKLAWSATAPTISSGFCTTPLISSANGTAAFTITIGSACAATTGVLTMPAATTGWKCDFSDVTNPTGNKPDMTASTTTSVNVSNFSRTTGAATNWTAADVIVVSCTAY